MAKYSAGVNSTAPAANAGMASLWTPAARSIRVVSIEVVATAATATDIALQRITARGTQTTTQVGAATDPLAGASTVQCDSAWSVQPTFSGVTMRRILLNAAGNGVVWRWDDTDPLIVAAAAGIALRHIGGVAGGICSISMEWDEA